MSLSSVRYARTLAMFSFIITFHVSVSFATHGKEKNRAIEIKELLVGSKQQQIEKVVIAFFAALENEVGNEIFDDEILAPTPVDDEILAPTLVDIDGSLEDEGPFIQGAHLLRSKL